MDSQLPTTLDATQLDSYRDWSYPLLTAQNSIRIACNCLSLVRVLSPGAARDSLSEQMREKAVLELTEAKVAINDALATLRD